MRSFYTFVFCGEVSMARSDVDVTVGVMAGAVVGYLTSGLIATGAIGIAATISSDAGRGVAAGALAFFLGATANCCTGCLTSCCVDSVTMRGKSTLSPMAKTMLAVLLVSSLAAGLSSGLSDNALLNIGVTWAAPAAAGMLVCCCCGLMAACLHEAGRGAPYVLPMTHSPVPGDYVAFRPQRR
jgi:hypothetical protein